MKITGISQSIRRVLGALLFGCVLLCGAALAAEYPESDHPYTSNLDKTWTYTHPTAAESLDVTFSSDTELENNYDKLYITDGAGNTTTYTGTALAGQTIRLTGNTFTLRLTTDNSVNKNGFTITNITASVSEYSLTITNNVVTGYSGTPVYVTVPEGVTSIGEKAFYNCDSLVSVELPNTVTKIESSAFSGCSALRSVTLPSSLKTIGSYAFSRCERLNSRVLPDGITSVGAGCFPSYKVNYPVCNPSSTTAKTLTAAGMAYSLLNDDGLTYIIDTNGNAVITGYVGEEPSLGIPSTIAGSSVVGIGHHSFAYNDILTNVIVPSGVTQIGDTAFGSCKKLVSIDLPETLTSMGTFVFSSCDNLPGITMPSSLTTIPNYTFWNCTNLSNVTLGKNLTKIGSYAFKTCSSLRLLNLPDKITSIASDAFDSGLQLNCVIGTPTDTTLTSAGISHGRTNHFYYTENADGSCVITGYWGDSTEPIIPPDIFGRTVVGIAREAFSNNTAITSITIPSTVKSIGYWAFDGCTNLQNVYAADAASWVAIDFDYEKASPLYYADNLYFGGTLATNVVIPSGVTAIGDYAFLNCKTMTSVTLPEGLTTIGQEAFYSCTGLTSITFPASLTASGYDAFYGCTGLTKVYAASLTDWLEIDFSYSGNPMSYAKNLYLGGSLITDVVIPNGTTEIGYYAFYNCESMTSITIPASVQKIGSSAFWNCKALKNVYVADLGSWVTCIKSDTPMQNGSSLYVGGELLTHAEIPAGVTSIGRCTFENCTTLQSVTIPEGVTSIGNWAFQNCSALTSVTIPGSVTGIGIGAFSDCKIQDVYAADLASWLAIDFGDQTANPMTNNYSNSAANLYFGNELVTDVVVPDGVTEIGDYTFYGCSSLRSIRLPSTLETIGGYAFNNCTALTSIEISEGVAEIGNNAFENCSNLQSIRLPQSVREIGRNAFSSCEGLTSIVIPEGVTSMGQGAFTQCHNLVDVTLPSTLTTIPGWAFGTTGITSLFIPEGVTTIGNSAFVLCVELQSVSLPSTLTTIENGAFQACPKLTEIVLPNHITQISKWIYDNNYPITLYCNPGTTTEATLIKAEIPYEYPGPFAYADNGDGTCTITGYTGSETDLVIPSQIFNRPVTGIGDYAFSDCTSLQSVTILEGVTQIGNYAFQNCTGLTSITLPGSVTSIGGGAFNGCTIQDVYAKDLASWLAIVFDNIYANPMGGHYEEIVLKNLYFGNELVTEVVIPADVTAIGDYAFTNCTGLQSISLPEGLETIGTDAFSYCVGLTEIVLPDTVTQLGIGAFRACQNLVDVKLPDGLTNINQDTFRFCTALTSVVLPDTVTSIGVQAFCHCYSLAEVSWPENLEIIEGVAFGNCNFTQITLPEKVTSIAYQAFVGCGSLKEIVLPDQITFVGEMLVEPETTIFCRANTITEQTLINAGIPYVAELPFTYRENDDGTATITGYTGTSANVTIPSEIDGLTVTAIGDSAFTNNKAITSVVIPEGVTRIGWEAFWACSNLQNVSLPSTLKAIENYAFCWCMNLSELTIPASVTEIGWSFFGTSADITVESGSESFAVVDGVLYSKDLKTLKHCPADRTGVFVIPEGTEVIDGRAFFGCHSLTEIRIPASVKDVSKTPFSGAFATMSSLERFVVDEANTEYQVVNSALLTKDGRQLISVPASVTGSYTVPEGVKTIRSFAFDGGYGEGITEVVLLDSVVCIENQAFCDLKLEKINLPAGMTQIDDAAFGNCGSFTATVYENTYAHRWCVDNGIAVEVLPADGMIFPLPGGRVCNSPLTPVGFYTQLVNRDSGLLQIVLDGDACDWDAIVTSAVMDGGQLVLPIDVQAPTGAVAFRHLLCDAVDENTLNVLAQQDAELTDPYTDEINHFYLNIPYAYYDEVTGLVTPTTLETEVVVQWLDENGDVLLNETFSLAFGQSTVDSIHAEINWFDMSTVTPNYHGVEGVTSRVEDNTLIYTVPEGCEEVISTSFPVPEGTATYRTTIFDWMSRLPLLDGAARWGWNMGGVELPFEDDSAVIWFDEEDSYLGCARVSVRYEHEAPLTIQPMPASRISDQGVPYGLDVDVEITDGSIHAVFDDENTNWNDVYTFLEPREWHDSITGESGVDYELRFGAYFYVPEGAAYAKVAVGENWSTDEEILAYLSEEAELETLMQGMRFGYWYRPATLNNGTVTLNEVGVEAPFVHVIQWLDEEQNVIATEKATIRFEHTNPDKTYTSTRTLIPAESIIANAENASGVTAEVADGSVSYTQNKADTVIVTEIIAPEGAVEYSAPGETFDADAERWPVDNGKIGYAREGTLTDPVTAWDFICWYDADGNLLGGGWIDFRYERAEALSFQPIPASRISFREFPYGMSVEDQTTDGQVHIVIDDEATDWNKVLTFNEASPWYNPDTGEEGYFEPTSVMFSMYIAKPEGAAYTNFFPCRGVSEEDLIEMLTLPENMVDAARSIPSWRLDVAEYDAEAGVFLPINVGAEDYTGPTTYAVAWADENKDVFLVEKVEVRYEHTSPDGSFPAEYVKLAADDILPNAEQAGGVTASVADGAVLYMVQQDAKPESVVTCFTAPENAAYYTLTEDVRYEYADQYAVADGCAEQIFTLDEPESTTYVLVWLDEAGNVLGGGRVSIGWEAEPVQVVVPMPAANIHPDDLPFGMAADVTVEDGLFKVVIDDEATDWNDVFTFLDPLLWHNPDTDESGAYTDTVMVGAQMADYEGAVYSKSIVGNVWETDEELLAALDRMDDIEDLTSYGHGWWHNIAEFDSESGTVTLKEIINTPDYIYAVQWLDADQNVICTEKVVFQITHTNPDKTYASTRTLIPAESIVGNAENMDGVTCEIQDGLIVTTVENKQITTTTEIIAPANAVTYSMPALDTNGERWDLSNGRVGFQRMGWASAENETSQAYLLCWYDADGKLIGGGWITMTDVCPIPEMILPASTTEIGEKAFEGSGVQRVIIPDGCTAIGSRAFADCAQLSEVHIPDSVTSIAPDAFDGSLDVMIYAPVGSEGMRFAGDHDLKWANVSSFQ